MADGLLVVRRFNRNETMLALDRAWRAIDNNVHPIQLLNNYRGIEGEIWPECDESIKEYVAKGLAHARHISSILAYARALSLNDSVDFIYCRAIQEDNELPPGLESFEFLGIDFGLPPTEYTVFCYSAVYHDVVLARHERLARFRYLLNSNGLFSSVEHVGHFALCRDEVLRSGADLEDIGPEHPMEAMRIFGFKA